MFRDALNITFENGVIRTVRGIFQDIELERGATITDRATGEPYCVTVENGEVIILPGSCAESNDSSTSPTPPVVPNSPTAAPELTATPTPQNENGTDDEPDAGQEEPDTPVAEETDTFEEEPADGGGGDKPEPTTTVEPSLTPGAIEYPRTHSL